MLRWLEIGGKHGEGIYNLMIREVYEIEFSNFVNPWTFHNLFTSSNEQIFPWLINKELLAEQITCEKCGTLACLKKRERNPDGYSFRCKGSKREYGMRKFHSLKGLPIKSVI